MSLLRAGNPTRSPFSEIRQAERSHTLMVIAISTLSASSCLITAVLVTLGIVK